MRHTVLAVLFTALAVCMAPAQHQLVKWNGHFYGTTPPSGWLAAESYAVGLGGHLVMFADIAENNFVLDRFAASPTGGTHRWIGLTAPSGASYTQPGVWRWVDGTTPSFQNWRPNQPDRGYGDDRFTVINFTHRNDPHWDNYPEGGYPGPLPGVFELTQPPGDSWVDLRGGLAGTGGDAPLLGGTGQLISSGQVSIDLTGALPNSSGVLVLALGSQPLPLFGGILLANPPLFAAPIAIDGAGAFHVPLTWGTVPAGAQVVFQALVLDTGALQGIAFSNGLVAVF